MKDSLKFALKAACLALMGFSLTACNVEQSKNQSGSDAVPVTVGKVQQVQELEKIAVSGIISTPNSPSSVSFLVSGKVEFVGPREGDYVKKGQKLAYIDPVDFKLSFDAARAQASIARVAFNRAEDEHRRMKMLHDSNSLAANDYQKFKAVFESAKQQYEQAAAMKRLSMKHFADATLYSPISGFISKRSIEPGDTAAPGHPVFEIAEMDPVEINVGVPETDVHIVRIGQKAKITIPAIPGKTFEGTVRVINVSADPGTRTYMTRITVPNPGHSMLMGMVVEAIISGDRMLSMTTLPGDAVVRDPQGATQVFVYYPEQKRVYAKRVEIGAVVKRNVEIRSGLSGNELVVIAGQTKLRNGILVSATEQQTDQK